MGARAAHPQHLGGIGVVGQLTDHRNPNGPLDIFHPVGAVADEHDGHPTPDRLAQCRHEMGQRDELIGDRVHEHRQEIGGGDDRYR
jgi:hypothetical protein